MAIYSTYGQLKEAYSLKDCDIVSIKGKEYVIKSDYCHDLICDITDLDLLNNIPGYMALFSYLCDKPSDIHAYKFPGRCESFYNLCLCLLADQENIERITLPNDERITLSSYTFGRFTSFGDCLIELADGYFLLTIVAEDINDVAIYKDDLELILNFIKCADRNTFDLTLWHSRVEVDEKSKMISIGDTKIELKIIQDLYEMI